MIYAATREETLRTRKDFEAALHHYPKVIQTVVKHWAAPTRYDDSPREHWKHLRAS
jgi:transposase-like protein